MTAWSFTALTAFETCPRRYWLTRVEKRIVEPETEATLWGTRVHKALELRLTGEALPEELAGYEPIAARVAALPGEVLPERQIALDKSFAPTEWFAKDTWVRGVLDVTVLQGKRALVLDWKTGRRKPASDQLKLFAGLAFAQWHEVDEISAGFVWLKEGKTDRETYQRGDVPTIWNEFIPRVARLELAFEKNRWPARPSGLCRAWCPVGKKNCEYCGTP